MIFSQLERKSEVGVASRDGCPHDCLRSPWGGSRGKTLFGKSRFNQLCTVEVTGEVIALHGFTPKFGSYRAIEIVRGV